MEHVISAGESVEGGDYCVVCVEVVPPKKHQISNNHPPKDKTTDSSHRHRHRQVQIHRRHAFKIRHFEGKSRVNRVVARQTGSSVVREGEIGVFYLVGD